MSSKLIFVLMLAVALALPDLALASVEPIDAAVILDPAAASEARLAELRKLKANAQDRDHVSICMLGRLAFAGSRHPAKLPEFEYGDAASLLSRCVLGGDLDAMLVMAELEVRQRRALEAMIWMQTYLKLAAAINPEMANEASAYKAGILARIEKLYYGVRPSNEEVLEYAAGFLANYGDRIAAAFQKGGWQAELPLAPQGPLEMRSSSSALSGRFARDMTAAEDELIFAKFLVKVDPSGKPQSVLVVESYPDAKAARALRSFAVSRRFNAVETEAPSRWLYLPVYLDNKAFDLLPDADAKFRPKH